jgi:hypothetical protein
MTNLSHLFLIILFVSFLIAIALLILEAKKQQQTLETKKQKRKSVYFQSRSRKSFSNRSEKRLITLLRGDLNTALRLVANLQKRYPEKDPNWYWEKAIYDLKRDRRA